MSWRLVGTLGAAGFLAMALLAAGDPDPLLPFLVYVGAAATGVSIARGRPCSSTATNVR